VSVTAGTVDPNVPLLLFVETLYGTLRVMVGSTDAGGIWRLGFTAPALAGWEFRCTAVTLLGGSPTGTCSATITFE